MKYNISYQIESISREQLIKYFKPEKVFSYCAECSNHGKIWSCPPHEIIIEDYLSPYKQVLIIGAKVHLNSDLIDVNNLQDSVMKLFLEGRKQFGDKLFELESKPLNSKILLAGTCYQCNECTRFENKACRFNDRLRYSLESIGFLVGDIVKDVLNDEIQWIKDGVIPEYLLSVGAIMLEHPVDSIEI